MNRIIKIKRTDISNKEIKIQKALGLIRTYSCVSDVFDTVEVTAASVVQANILVNKYHESRKLIVRYD